jgi:short-subunit dehydrogenase
MNDQQDRPNKGVVVVGSTSAIARATANEFAKRGWAVAVAARDEEENELIAADIRVRHDGEAHALPFDAEDFESHEAFMDRCERALDARIDGVVVCFGYMEEQDQAQKDFAIARRTVDVNYTAAISILERFAALFEKRQRGFIGAVSSVAGDRGRQSNYIYGSAKAGLSIYLEGLRNRLHHVGVPVTTIKPGFVDTKMSWGQVPFAASPESAGRAVVNAIEKKKNVVYVPFFWRYIMLLIRHIPEWQFKKMKM